MTTFADRVYELGGSPVGEPIRPFLGRAFYADANNGSNSNDGFTPSSAKATITAGITVQTANSTGLGDVIYVLPGTYAESITGTLTDVSLIGLGPTPSSVNVKPTDSYAYTGGLIRSRVENITFWSPSTSNEGFAAFYATYGSGAGSMSGSTINRCDFKGGHALSDVGLQIGAKAAAAVWEGMADSTVSNCGFYTGVSQTGEFQTAIMLFASDSTAQQAKKSAQRCKFVNNTIYAETAGIRCNVNSTNLHGCIFQGNRIRSHQTYGPTKGILCHYAVGSGDNTAMVIGNNICVPGGGDAIAGFKTWEVQGNIVSTGTGTPVGESPTT